jgi:hypothetical protein
MNKLLKEFLSYILVEETPAEKAKKMGLTSAGFGRWKNDQGVITHKTDGDNLVPVTGKEPDLPTGKKKSGEKARPPKTSGAKKPDTAKPNGAAGITPGVFDTDKQTSSGSTDSAFVDPNPNVESTKIAGTGPLRANDITDGIFSESTTIKLGPDQISTGIRQLLDPITGQAVDVSTPAGRQQAIKILDERLEKFRADGTIKQVCDALTNKETPTGERTALRKWLGNLGEIGGLRDILASGHEAYLYSDSNPKNDIVTLVECSDGSEAHRDIRVTAISTKSTSGKKVGRIDASALVYIMDSVAGKMIRLPGRGRDFNFKAENVAQALFGMQKRIYSTATRGDIKKGEKFGGSQRLIKVDSDRRKNYDEETLQRAEEQSASAKSERDPGGQRTLISARKITPEEVLQWFRNDKSPVYQKLLMDMTKIMDGNTDGATKLIGLLSSRLQKRVETSSDFRLNDFDDWMTSEIANILDAPHQETGEPSQLVFQSDMMISTFDGDKGYVGCAMVNGETMTERVENKYGNLSNMDTTEKMQNVLGWVMNPRGVGLDTKEGGYCDPMQRAVPPLKLLKKTDYKSVDKFMKSVCSD